MNRVDSASRMIFASARSIFQAFKDPAAMEQWLPPSNMSGTMLQFDFREGGSYRMRLRYAAPDGEHGKSADGVDDVEVGLVRIEEDRCIEQAIRFESEDPRFAGSMHMTWTFAPQAAGTLVTVRAENVPDGIRPEDHAEGFRASLENLAKFVGG